MQPELPIGSPWQLVWAARLARGRGAWL